MTDNTETKEKKAKLEEPKMEVIRFREGDIIAFYSQSDTGSLGDTWGEYFGGTGSSPTP